MTRFAYIPEYEDFFKALKLSLHGFARSLGVNSNRYFADILGIKGVNKENSFNSLLNPNTGKDLKARELFLLLDTLGNEYSKDFFNFLALRYDFVVSDKATSQTINQDNIKDLMLSIGGSTGNIFNTFITSNNDNKLDELELKELIKLSYTSRALLNEFEDNLKMKLKGLDYAL